MTQYGVHQDSPECRQPDQHQTSYSVGHHHRPGYTFPDTSFQKVMKEPLPPILAQQDQIPQEQKWDTTNSDYHDRKFPNGPYGQQPRYTRAPDHWKVDYLKDTIEKLKVSNFRRPLSPSQQMSETQEEYANRAPIDEPRTFLSRDKYNALPKDHADVQQLIKDDVPKIKPDTHYVMDPSMTKYLDPYISTSHMNHRPFAEGEQTDTKDQPTYWNCENYSKAWGHGPKRNPLPKDAVPWEKLPMRDTMVFKSATHIGPVPKKSVPVPHTGLKSEYTEHYKGEHNVNEKFNEHCALDTPYVQPAAGQKATYTAPGMYDTEYNNIGRPRPVSLTRGTHTTQQVA